MENAFKLDLEKIKKEARAQMDKGAVTPSYAHDRQAVINVLNEVLATEIVCSLRYRNNYQVAHGIHAESVAAEFKQHAEEEQQHADLVAHRIVQLGGEPNMDPKTLATRSHAPYTTSSNIRELLQENLVAERVAVATYSEIVRWLSDRDPTTRRMMETLLEKEEEHADELASLLEQS
jgi:bacterioferritin